MEKSCSVIQLLNISALVAIMLLAGLRVTVVDLISSIQQRQTLLWGLVANYLLVPVLTVGLLCAFHANPMVSMGFLILAVCPGAPVGAPLTDIAKGSVPLAVGLMIILAASSVVLSPILLMFLSSQLSLPPDLHIDYPGIIKTLLVAQLLPLGTGLCMRHWLPQFSKALIKPLAVLSLLLLVAVVVLVLVTQSEILAVFRLKGWIGMILLLSLSLTTGWLCGGKDRTTQKTVALVTASRNAGVGLVIALTNFSGTPAVASVVVYTLFSIVASLLLAIALRRGGVAPG